VLPGKSSEGDHEVVISVGPVHLSGRLTIPEGASGMVVFAHGSGSSRHSPRNRFVADVRRCEARQEQVAEPVRHLVDRQTYKTRRSAALAEWQLLAA